MLLQVWKVAVLCKVECKVDLPDVATIGVVAAMVGGTVVDNDAGLALDGEVPHWPLTNDKSSKAISPNTTPPTIPSKTSC